MSSNVQSKLCHRYQAGMQIVDRSGKILGDISSVHQEGNALFAVVDDSYEVELTGAAEIIDLCGTLRHGNPALKDPHIRLGALASATSVRN